MLKVWIGAVLPLRPLNLFQDFVLADNGYYAFICLTMYIHTQADVSETNIPTVT